MKYICYSCDCGCQFAVNGLDIDDEGAYCPNCGNPECDETGECIRDPKIEPDNDE